MKDISLGWCPDIPDLRDALIADHFEKHLPKRIDLRDEETENSLENNSRSVQMSCALSILKLLDWQSRNWQGKRVDADAEFIHQLAVKIQWGSLVQSVQGSAQGSIGLRSVLKTLKRFGAPPQHLCQMASSKWMLDRPELYGYADRFRAIQYIRLDSPWSPSQLHLNGMRQWLVQGQPFLIGFAVPHNVSRHSPIIPLDIHRGGTMGGTACLVMGYDDDLELYGQVNFANSHAIQNLESGAFLIQTTWGPGWPQTMWLPYAFVESRFACDAWAIKLDVA